MADDTAQDPAPAAQPGPTGLTPPARGPNERPWWAPDAQGFVIASIILIVAVSLFYRMTHPSETNDKLLDMMLTILFGTALVGIINYLFGSSRGSSAKDETTTQLINRLAPPAPPPQG